MPLNVANALTLLRFVLIPFFLAASFRGMYTAAFVLFLSAAITDILDGWIARRFNMKSRIGAILDPAADKIMMICGFLFYTFADLPLVRIPGWLTFAVFIRDFLIVTFAYLLYTRVQVTKFPPSWAGKVSTVLQATACAATIGVNAFVPQLLWVAELCFRLSLLMTLFSGWHYLRRAEQIFIDTYQQRA
jgi:cardiolipin synthase